MVVPDQMQWNQHQIKQAHRTGDGWTKLVTRTSFNHESHLPLSIEHPTRVVQNPESSSVAIEDP